MQSTLWYVTMRVAGNGYYANCKKHYEASDGVYTLFTSKLFELKDVYSLLCAEWVYAINHTQIRFSTVVHLEELCDKLRAATNHISSSTARTYSSRS